LGDEKKKLTIGKEPVGELSLSSEEECLSLLRSYSN